MPRSNLMPTAHLTRFDRPLTGGELSGLMGHEDTQVTIFPDRIMVDWVQGGSNHLAVTIISHDPDYDRVLRLAKRHNPQYVDLSAGMQIDGDGNVTPIATSSP